MLLPLPEGSAILLIILALPLVQQVFSDAQRLGYITARRINK
ncbi:hypothetical protein [Pseudomonas sp. GZD-222]